MFKLEPGSASKKKTLGHCCFLFSLVRQKKKPQPKSSARLSLGRGSHCYIEESVISVTSYDSAIDEFGESVRLDRGMLHPMYAVLPLLHENGHLRVDKRSCSLPNLLSDSSPRPASYPGPSEGDVSLLSGWLQTEEEGNRNSANLEIISEEAQVENLETCASGAERGPDEISIHETTEGSSSNAFTDRVQISSINGAAPPNFHFNGCVNNTAKVPVCRDVSLEPEHKQNGHLLGKARLKRTGTGFDNSCALQAVNNCDRSDERTSAQDSPQAGVSSTRKPLHLSHRTAHLAEGIV